MKTICHSFLPFCIAIVLVALASNGKAQELKWETDFGLAAQKANQQNKMLLLHFTAQWCRACNELETFVFASPIVARDIQENLIPVKVDVDLYPELAEEYAVTSVPFDVVITTEGRVVMRKQSPKTVGDYSNLGNTITRTAQLVREEKVSLAQNLKEVQDQLRPKVNPLLADKGFTPSAPTHQQPAPAREASRLAQRSAFDQRVVQNPFYGTAQNNQTGLNHAPNPAQNSNNGQFNPPTNTEQNLQTPPERYASAAEMSNLGSDFEPSRQQLINNPAANYAPAKIVTTAPASQSIDSDPAESRQGFDSTQSTNQSGERSPSNARLRSPIATTKPQLNTTIKPEDVAPFVKQEMTATPAKLDATIPAPLPEQFKPYGKVDEFTPPTQFKAPATPLIIEKKTLPDQFEGNSFRPQATLETSGVSAKQNLTPLANFEPPKSETPVAIQSEFQPDTPKSDPVIIAWESDESTTAVESSQQAEIPVAKEVQVAEQNPVDTEIVDQELTVENAAPQLAEPPVEYSRGMLQAKIPVDQESTATDEFRFQEPQNPIETADQVADPQMEVVKANPQLPVETASEGAIHFDGPHKQIEQAEQVATPAVEIVATEPVLPTGTEEMGDFRRDDAAAEIELVLPTEDTVNQEFKVVKTDPNLPVETTGEGTFRFDKPTNALNQPEQALAEAAPEFEIAKPKTPSRAAGTASLIVEPKTLQPLQPKGNPLEPVATTNKSAKAVPSRVLSMLKPLAVAPENSDSELKIVNPDTELIATKNNTSAPADSAISMSEPKIEMPATERAGVDAQDTSSEPAAISTEPAQSESKPTFALKGKCPVTLLTQSQWVDGNERFGCVHRGRTYTFASKLHMQTFLADPDRYSPMLAGYDPVIFHDKGLLVEGEESTGVFMGKAPDQRIVLFANEATKTRFQSQPDIYLESIRQAMKAAEPNGEVRR